MRENNNNIYKQKTISSRRQLQLALLTLLGFSSLLFIISSCARMGEPDGGWYDEAPPKVIGASPADKAIDVNSKKVVISFDEFIKLENASEKVVVSPPQLEVPEIKGQGKSISVKLLDELKPNTTYTIDFSDAISDNNEGNPLGNYTYSFSTGNHIDTMEVAGYVLEAENLEPIKGILVGLYSNQNDTAFQKLPMLRVSRTDSRGHFSIKGVAKKLGKTADYKYFYDRSQSYRKYYFDKNTGFMRGRLSDGTFREPFDPFSTVHRQDDYTEGNAWQYAWLVPHDVHGLVKAFGGEKKFVEKFDSLFVVTGEMGKDASPDITGLIGQYAHGNEPSHHIIYMYNYIGQPYKAAPLLRKVMKEMYHDNFDGLIGNEDVGQMSAWYILSSLGLYQVEPAGGKFIFGSPIFDEAKVNVGNGKTLSIITKNNSDENKFIQSVRLNGKPYTRSYIMFSDIKKGGTLEFTMGNQPSKFGTSVKARP